MAGKITVDASGARQRFFELLDLVERDKKEVLIQKRGKIKAKLVAFGKGKPDSNEIARRLEAVGMITSAGGVTISLAKMKKIITSKNLPYA